MMRRTAPFTALILIITLLGNSLASYGVDDPSRVDSPERRFDVIFFVALPWTLLWSYIITYLISAVVRQEGVPLVPFDDEWQMIGIATVFFALAIAIYDVRKLNERLSQIEAEKGLPPAPSKPGDSKEDSTKTDGDKKNGSDNN
jgi:hypothetical protein